MDLGGGISGVQLGSSVTGFPQVLEPESCSEWSRVVVARMVEGGGGEGGGGEGGCGEGGCGEGEWESGVAS